jgi:beta-lactamase superfamily II metal-dependent hydrolase
MCRTVAVAASAALIFSALSVPPADAGDLTIYNIEVGLDSSSGSYAQGDSALIQFPNGKTMLIDGGNSNDYGGNTVLAVFNLIGFTGPLDYVVCSHFHTDHMNGLVTVCTADNYRFRPTAANSVFDNGDAAGPSSAYSSLFSGKRKKPAVGETLTIGSGADLCTVTFVTVNGGIYGGAAIDTSDPNDSSIAVLITFGGFDYLSLGDLSSSGEDELAAAWSGLGRNVDVLKVSHHGSTTSTSNAFVSAIRPEYAVISAGNGTGWSHPNQYTLNHLNAKTSAGAAYSPAYPACQKIFTLEHGDGTWTCPNAVIVGNGSTDATKQGALKTVVYGGGSYYSFTNIGQVTNNFNYSGIPVDDAGGATATPSGPTATPTRTPTAPTPTPTRTPTITPTPTDTPSGTAVVVNQVCPFSSPGEYVELYNNTGSAVNLAGWQLDVYSNDYTFTASDIIPAHGYFLVSDTSPVSGVTADVYTDINITDNGVNSFAQLKDGSGTVVDKVGWSSSSIYEGTKLGTLPAGKAWKRVTDGADTDNNANDFSAITPAPRNRAYGQPTATPTPTRTPTPTITPTPTQLPNELFSDNFDAYTAPALDTGKWTSNVGPAETVTEARSSLPNSLNLNGYGDPDTGGGDVVQSRVIDLSGHVSAQVAFAYACGGSSGDLPEKDDQMWVAYLNNVGEWTTLVAYPGGTRMTSFAAVTLELPADALHAGFRLQFASSGTYSKTKHDDWYIDNVKVLGGPTATPTPTPTRTPTPTPTPTPTRTPTRTPTPTSTPIGATPAPVRVNFQPAEASAPGDGWAIDTGMSYGQGGYGWR